MSCKPNEPIDLVVVVVGVIVFVSVLAALAAIFRGCF